MKSGNIETGIPLNAFPSPEQLWQKYKAFKGITDDIAPVVAQDYFSDGSNRAPRYYQQIAINRTVEAIARNEGNNRHLLVMATGCGKTYAAFQIIYRLWKSGLKKRILFLADRTDLIDQTVRNDFRHFKEAMTVIKHRHIDTAYNIYLALYQGLADIARHSLGKMLDKGKNRGTEKPYLRNLNVRWYEVELSDLETMPFEEHESEKYSVRRGDVLICEGGHGIGRAAVWNSDDTVMFQKALHRVRFFGGFFEPELFVHFLRWSETSGHIAKFYIGAGIPHLTGDSIHDMPVPLPPLAEQAAIVARVATLLGSSRMLALELAASRTPAAHLLQAVLKSVFTPAA